MKKYILTVTVVNQTYRFNIHDAPGDFRVVASLPDGTSLMGSEAAKLLEAMLGGPGKIYGYNVIAVPTLVVPVEAGAPRPRALGEVVAAEAAAIGILFTASAAKLVAAASAVSEVAAAKSWGETSVEDLVVKLASAPRTAVVVASAGLSLAASGDILYVSEGIYRFNDFVNKPKKKHTVTVLDAAVRSVPVSGPLIDIGRKVIEGIEGSGDLEELYKIRYGYAYLAKIGDKEIAYSIIAHAKAARAVKSFVEMLVTTAASQYGYTYRRIRLPTRT